MQYISEKKLTHQTLADKFRIKINAVRHLARDVKKGSPSLKKRIQKHEEKLEETNSVHYVVQQMQDQGVEIFSIDQVKQQVHEIDQKEISNTNIGLVLK